MSLLAEERLALYTQHWTYWAYFDESQLSCDLKVESDLRVRQQPPC